MWFGEYVKTLRLEYGLTLRELARKVGMDVGNLSKIERGVLNPPQKPEILDQLADAIGVTKDERKRLHDLAAQDNGQFPMDIAEDLKEMPALPILLRTIANKKLTREEMEELAKRINKEY